MKKLFLTTLLSLSFINLTYAQDGLNIWSTSLSGAGLIFTIAINPSNQAIMYAGSNTTGIWKTSNSGVNWAQSNSGLTNLNVFIVAVSRSNPNVLYCGTGTGAGAGMYKSTDAAATWTQINSGIVETSIGIQAIAIDPGNSDIAYMTVFDGAADSPQGVYKTINGGTTWTAANTGMGAIKNVLSIIINPLNSNVLYLGTSFMVTGATGPSKIYKSVNAAGSWTDMSSGLPSLTTEIKPVRCLSMSTVDTSVILAGLFMNTDTLGGGMYLTKNGGGAWTRIHNAGLPNVVGTLPRSCLIRPGSATEFFVGLQATPGGVFRTKNSGLTWADYNNGTLTNTNVIRALNYKTGGALDAGTPLPVLYAGGAGTLAGVFERTVGTLDVSVIMEGFYDPAANNMRLSDIATAYFRNSTSPYAIVDSSTALINATTFTGSFLMDNAPTGTYYLVVKHRNTIETWSAATSLISYTQPSTVSYNFTTAASQAFGNNMIQVDASPIRFGIFSGDVTQDGIVDGSDAAIIDNDAFNFVTGYVPSDLTGDGIVDGSDGAIADNNAFNFVSVIRPTPDNSIESIESLESIQPIESMNPGSIERIDKQVHNVVQ